MDYQIYLLIGGFQSAFLQRKNRELKDAKIVEALQQAAVDYENGEIAEVRDLLADIVKDIDEFERNIW